MSLHIVMMFLFFKVLTNNKYSYFSFKKLFILFIIIRLFYFHVSKKYFFYFLFNIIKLFKFLIFNFYSILLKFSNFSFIYIKIFNNLVIKKYVDKKN
jgi:hypothetical protein